MDRAYSGPIDVPRHLEEAFIKVTFEEEGGLSEALSGEGKDQAYGPWIDNASFARSDTELFGADLLKKQYPKHSLVISKDRSINLLAFPFSMAQPLHPDQLITDTIFIPLARRAAPIPGLIAQQVQYGAFRYAWDKYEFIVYIVQFPVQFYGPMTCSFILHEGSEQPARDLILAAGIWREQLHDEILVFNQGFWRKSHELWVEIQKANWADVILKDEFKTTMHKDIYGFFKSEPVYKELAIPWKRGIIMYGPPGNGKTISIKAIMKECHEKGFAPLYVKSFQSWKGEEGAMQDVFEMGRQMSPCVIIFEDLDALITDRNRSFFLNQLDGFEGNDGLLCIGTTNHFEALDPALSTRPSRFDRKYLFDDPDREERTLYAKYWQKKLATNKAISFPDALVDEIAKITDKFSFAYLKEAFVSTLVLLATQETNEKQDFETVLKRTIEELRKQLDKPRDVRPRAAEAPTAATPPPKPSPRDSVSVRSMALAAAALGRSFIA